MLSFSSSPFLRALCRAAPSLSQEFFGCRQRLRLSSRALHLQLRPQTLSLRPKRAPEAVLRGVRSISSVAAAEISPPASSKLNPAPRFPDSSSNVVAYWLLGSAASVFGIVVFGGLTRLTESGLSITEWKPVTGSLPPLSEADWASEFLKYQSSPEFHLLNPHMALDEFKSIYWMEWIHRLWGRAIGISFILPGLYFVARRHVSKAMMLRLVGISGLIGFQGLIGWWMVKSGLKDDLFASGSHPRVSQYRLTAHLGAAFLCYSAMLWNGLSILRANNLLAMSPTAATGILSTLSSPQLKVFQRSVVGLALLVFTTAMSGGLVAGLDAGLIYNEFPQMGLGLTPPKSELLDKFYSRDPEQRDLYWRNMLENPSLVQLDHRILATTTFASVMALWAYSKFSPTMRKHLPRTAKRGVYGVVGFVWLQVILGISTLIYLVPLPLASAHQAGSLALLTWTLVLGSRVWYPSAAARLFAKRLAAMRSTGGGDGGIVTSGEGLPLGTVAAARAGRRFLHVNKVLPK